MYSFSPANALKMFSLPSSSSICVCSVEAGLNSVFMQKKKILSFGTGLIFGN